MPRVLTHKIELAVALGRREDAHAVLDSYLGTMPGGRPVVRLSIPLERLDAPGVVAAWGASTGARASVYASILTPMMQDMITDATAVDAITPISHVRWPSVADQSTQSRAVGYLIIATRDSDTGAWTQLYSRDQMLSSFGLARLSGTPEEQAAAIDAAELVEAAV